MLKAYWACVRELEAGKETYPLSRYRTDKLRCITDPGQYSLSLGAELLLIKALERQGAVELPLDIHRSGRGKPRLAQGPEFCLSHSGELVFCAISDEPVGADVQKLARPAQTLVQRCLSGEERRWMDIQKDPDMAFTILWSLKESYLKLDGRGIAGLRSASARLLIDPQGGAMLPEADVKLWYKVSEGYVFSLCSRYYTAPDSLEELRL